MCNWGLGGLGIPIRSRYYNRGYGHAALYNQSILANEMLANQLYTTQMMTPGMAYVDPYRRYSTYNRYLYSGGGYGLYY